MPNPKKDKDRPKKEKPKPESSDEDSDPDDEEEEEVVESEHVRRKREKGRSAFLKLIRRCLAFIPLAVVLSRQPFVVRPRGSGTNAAKVRPIDLAISGAAWFAVDSPTFMRKPQLHVYLNNTGKALLTPFEYMTAQQSKRAMPAEKTIAGAYKKSAKSFARLVDKEPATKEMATAPQPNLLLIGSLLVVLSVLLCPLVGGIFEYGIVIGCVVIMQGGRQLGMEAQPELYVAGGVAVLSIAAAEAMAGKSAPAKPMRKRK